LLGWDRDDYLEEGTGVPIRCEPGTVVKEDDCSWEGVDNDFESYDDDDCNSQCMAGKITAITSVLEAMGHNRYIRREHAFCCRMPVSQVVNQGYRWTD
jgi:hypothetical protein